MLFYIGHGDSAKVLHSVRINLRYYFSVLVSLAIFLFFVRGIVTKLFFSNPDMQAKFVKMIFFYSMFLVFNCSIPGLATLLRIFDMNLHSSLIVFFVFGAPYIFQNYAYVVYFHLEYYSPVLSLAVCNILVVSMSVFFLWKNLRSSLSRKVKQFSENSKDTQLLDKASGEQVALH